MFSKIHLFGLGLVAACALFVAPSLAQAQHYHRDGYGQRGYAPRYNNYSNYGNYGNYGRGYNNYQPSYNSYRPNYDYYQRPVIVHPETIHWTPGRGFHTHGHLHVPHGNHYHVRPY